MTDAEKNCSLLTKGGQNHASSPTRDQKRILSPALTKENKFCPSDLQPWGRVKNIAPLSNLHLLPPSPDVREVLEFTSRGGGDLARPGYKIQPGEKSS